MFHQNNCDLALTHSKAYYCRTYHSLWFSQDITEFMNVAMDAKCVKLDCSLTKHLPITNPTLGPHFLAQVKRHYDLCSDKSQMNQETL